MKLVILFTVSLFVISCGNSGSPKNRLGLLTPLPINTDSLKGIYTGDFNGSPVSIVLHFFSGRRVSGYNIHKGLKRNIAGTMSLTGRQVQFDLSEPGTNKHDGRFKIFIDTLSKQVKGWWTSFSDKNNVVHFTLEKKGRVANDENYGFILVDTLKNSFEFFEDGSCAYTYLSGDSSNTAQQFTVKGNYKIEQDSVLNIFWEANNIFPSRKSVFNIHFSTPPEEGDVKLKSITLEDGHIFSELYD